MIINELLPSVKINNNEKLLIAGIITFIFLITESFAVPLAQTMKQNIQQKTIYEAYDLTWMLE